MSEKETRQMAGVDPDSIEFKPGVLTDKIKAKSYEVAIAASESIGDETQGKNVINNPEVAQALAEKDAEKIATLEEEIRSTDSLEEIEDKEAEIKSIKTDGFGEAAIDEATTVIAEHATGKKAGEGLEDLKFNRHGNHFFLTDAMQKAKNYLFRKRNN